MRKNDQKKMVDQLAHWLIKLFLHGSCYFEKGGMHRCANLLLIILFWHVFAVASESFSEATSDIENHFNQKLIPSNNHNLQHHKDSEVTHESDSYFRWLRRNKSRNKLKSFHRRHESNIAGRKAKCEYQEIFVQNPEFTEIIFKAGALLL